MIVQAAPRGGRHFVITMQQHTALAGMLARSYGNADFPGLVPREPMEFVVANHDRGWVDFDARAPQDPATGLPVHLIDTPLEESLPTAVGSPDANEAHHPFSGLISSMHSCALYGARLDQLGGADLRSVQAVLEHEAARQRRLRELVDFDDAAIQRAYKQLQFFDRFALYLHVRPEGARGVARIEHVPAVEGDAVVEVRERPGAFYEVDPYPFSTDGLEVFTEGRYLEPQPPGTDLAAVLGARPIERQPARLISP